ncbi:ABC transporter permease [Streptomyces sp. NPDC057253]|uniref:ABC transporter permease n=1 Tax=Streptomyces sp. NPDC057253 TaxID=3346069 RepID=UPI003644373F
MSPAEDLRPADTQPAPGDAPPQRPTARAAFVHRAGLDRLSGVYALAALVLLYGLWVPDTFLTTTTLRTVSANQSVTAIVAMALILPVAAGLFDLSVAATLGVGAVLTVQLQADGRSLGVTLLLVLLTGLGVGVVNSALVVGVGVDSFIATLGTSSLLSAFAYWITEGNQVILPPGSRLTSFGQGTLLGVPTPVWYVVAAGLILFYVTELTTAGRYAYAVGGNKEAARLIGVRVGRVSVWALLASSLMATVAGVVLAAELGATDPNVGPPYLLPAFSAVLLGATQVKTNGRVNVLGTLLAVALLGTGIYGLQLAGAPTYVSDLFNGAALIIAVSLALLAHRRTRR